VYVLFRERFCGRAGFLTATEQNFIFHSKTGLKRRETISFFGRRTLTIAPDCSLVGKLGVPEKNVFFVQKFDKHMLTLFCAKIKGMLRVNRLYLLKDVVGKWE
jgi:hypothetical protein